LHNDKALNCIRPTSKNFVLTAYRVVTKLGLGKIVGSTPIRTPTD
jgi:hypothetical protein